VNKCEICNTLDFLDEHHIQSKSKGGNNKSYNRAKICPSCHRKVHKKLIILEGFFFTTLGRKLIWHYNGEESLTGSEPSVYILGENNGRM